MRFCSFFNAGSLACHNRQNKTADTSAQQLRQTGPDRSSYAGGKQSRRQPSDSLFIEICNVAGTRPYDIADHFTRQIAGLVEFSGISCVFGQTAGSAKTYGTSAFHPLKRLLLKVLRNHQCTEIF